MDILLTGVIAGVLGTLAMDLLNHLFARIGLILRIDVAMIGRIAAGWTHNSFRYDDPSEIEQVEHEKLIGYLTHYMFGIGLAVLFTVGWDLLVGGPISSVWALVYGVTTTVNSVFFVYPVMGLGVFGRYSPEGLKAPISSLTNHIFFGAGMAVGVALV